MNNDLDIAGFIGELGAGVFEQKLRQAISATALASMQHKRVGEITLTFKLTPISEQQAKIQHKIVNKFPTLNGEASEKNVTDTVMYVYTKGNISMFPENQMPMFGKNGETTTQKV